MPITAASAPAAAAAAAALKAEPAGTEANARVVPRACGEDVDEQLAHGDEANCHEDEVTRPGAVGERVVEDVQRVVRGRVDLEVLSVRQSLTTTFSEPSSSAQSRVTSKPSPTRWSSSRISLSSVSMASQCQTGMAGSAYGKVS